MEWTDYILSARPMAKRPILDVLTRDHGRHAAGARSKNRACCKPAMA